MHHHIQKCTKKKNNNNNDPAVQKGVEAGGWSESKQSWVTMNPSLFYLVFTITSRAANGGPVTSQCPGNWSQGDYIIIIPMVKIMTMEAQVRQPRTVPVHGPAM